MRPLARLVTMAAALLALSAAAPPDRTVRLLLTGDVSFGENYQVESERRGRPNVLKARGYDHSLAGLAAVLRRADYSIVNLETPLTAMPQSPLADTGKEYIHWSHPDKAPAKLIAYGVDAVGLANNHTLDFGAAGLADTFAALRRYGIAAFGAGATQAEAQAPLVRVMTVGAREVTVAVVAAFERRASYEKLGFYAGPDRPGVNMLDAGAMRDQVAELRRRHPGVFVIAYPHWGANYAWRSPQQQVQARAMIDAGVDLIVGHHGHMLQEIERYRGKWIVYGLGNFMFNAGGRFANFPEAVPYGLALELALSDRRGAPAAELRLYPVASDNQKTDYQPRIVRGADAERAFDALVTRSALGNDARLISRGADAIGPFLRLPQALPPPG